MRRRFLSVAALCVLAAAAAFGADDGNTKWRLTQGYITNYGSTYDIIPTTNGTGNVKGLQCKTDTNLTLNIYVNGGSAETITFPADLVGDGFIPFNIRFTSSIRVTAYRSGGSNYVDQICTVSWGLD